jgi:hypothetical protein
MSDQIPPQRGGDDPIDRGTDPPPTPGGVPPQPAPWGAVPPATPPGDPFGQQPPGTWAQQPGYPVDGLPGAAYPRKSQAVPALVFSVLGLPFCCGPLSIVGLFMGRAEMNAIDRGESDPTKRGTAQAAYIIGIIGAAFLVLGILAYLFFIVVAVSTSPS